MSDNDYQDFGSGGDSASSLKLEQLCLPGRLDGKTVLDLGCNAGFFCIEAVKRGAEKAVGFEMRPRFYEDAIRNAEEAGVADKCEFVLGNWLELIQLREEQFDYVLWLAAMHYERRPGRMAELIRGKMENDGTLILDVGLAGGSPVQTDWMKLRRPGETDSYPTEKMLYKVFSDFVLRYQGVSTSLPNQGTRLIYHGTPRKPIVLLVGGTSGDGKTILTEMLSHEAVRLSTDPLLSRLDQEPVNLKTEFGRMLAEFREEKGSLCAHQTSLGVFFNNRPRELFFQEMAALLCYHVNPDFPVYVIEGGLLRNEEFVAAVKREIGSGYVIWNVERI